MYLILLEQLLLCSLLLLVLRVREELDRIQDQIHNMDLSLQDRRDGEVDTILHRVLVLLLRVLERELRRRFLYDLIARFKRVYIKAVA